jgi:hypothetical protein
MTFTIFPFEISLNYFSKYFYDDRKAGNEILTALQKGTAHTFKALHGCLGHCMLNISKITNFERFMH